MSDKEHVEPQQFIITHISVMVGDNLLESYFSPAYAMEVLLNDQQVNEVLKAWVGGCKGLAALQPFITNMING